MRAVTRIDSLHPDLVLHEILDTLQPLGGQGSPTSRIDGPSLELEGHRDLSHTSLSHNHFHVGVPSF